MAISIGKDKMFSPIFKFASDSVIYSNIVRVISFFIIRSTSESRPNSIEGKNVRPYVRPSTKSFFNLNESWYIGRGR